MDHTPYLSVSILIRRKEAHPGSLRITAKTRSSSSDFDFMIISQAVHTGLKPQVPRLVLKMGAAAVRRKSASYFFEGLAALSWAIPFALGAAAITFGFSFFGFFFSRFPRCSPLAMVQSSGLRWVNRCIDDCCCSLEV